MGGTGEKRAELERCTKVLKIRFGLTVRGIALARLLEYPNLSAFYRARAAGLVGVPLRQIPRQKGRCATTADVAKWLVDNGKKWERLVEEAVAASKK